MINEEIRKFEELTGKNANDFSIAYVGGYLDGYDKGKAETPALDPSFITDLNDVKDWRICGYRVEDLVKLSFILRDKDINEINLKDFTETYTLGYLKASEDLDKALENYVFSMISETTPESFVESVVESVVRSKEAADNDNKQSSAQSSREIR